MSSWRRLAVAALLTVAGCGGGHESDAGSELSATSPAATVAEQPGQPQGFSLRAAKVTAADGEVCEVCVWLADSGAERSRGLMGVTDLGPAQAMAFLYPRPTTTSFWMLNTPLPLSIAFFDADGAFLDSFDMEPCGGLVCPSYATAPDFTVALEAPQGTLPDLLIAPGSTLTLLDLPCA